MTKARRLDGQVVEWSIHRIGLRLRSCQLVDPKAYTRTWTSQTMKFVLQPDTELLEHLCENNRDFEHLQEIWKQK